MNEQRELQRGLLAMDDPFNTIRGGVSHALALLETQHAKWSAERRRKPVVAEKVTQLYRELTVSIEEVEADLADLDTTVKLVEGNRAKFRQLDDAEVASRRTFVRSSLRATQSIRTDLTSNPPPSGSSRSKLASAPNERIGLLAPSATPLDPAESARGAAASAARAAARESADAALMSSHQTQQMQALERQEETLGVLGEAVGRLKNLGGAMNDELGAQNIMIRDLDSQIDQASGSMALLKAKMTAMAKSKDRGKICTIISLTGVLFFLLMLVMYT